LVNFIFNPAEKRIITKKKKNRQTNSIKTTHRTKKRRKERKKNEIEVRISIWQHINIVTYCWIKREILRIFHSYWICHHVEWIAWDGYSTSIGP